MQVGVEGREDTREPGYYDYKLKGVLIHAGTSDSGHYYSIIKERSGNENWFMFNDASVTPFDPDKIAHQCFGGTMLNTRWDHTQNRQVQIAYEKNFSAYLLIYERGTTVFEDDPAKNDERERVAEEDEEGEAKMDVDEPPAWRPPYHQLEEPSSIVPKSIFTDIWKENKQVSRERAAEAFIIVSNLSVCRSSSERSTSSRNLSDASCSISPRASRLTETLISSRLSSPSSLTF